MTATRGEDITMPLVAVRVLINPLKFQFLQKLNSFRPFTFESFFDVHFQAPWTSASVLILIYNSKNQWPKKARSVLQRFRLRRANQWHNVAS
jgi:hypothetical protein